MPRTSSARASAISTAADLFRRRGYAATGLEEILDQSGAPKGSFYHHFPGGKDELAIEALDLGGRRVRQLVDQLAADAGSPGALVVAIASKQAEDLRQSQFEWGCPVATVALELAGSSDRFATVASKAYASWIEPLAAMLERHGKEPGEALRLARWAFTSLEGALLLARVARDASIVTEAAAITAHVLDVGK